MAPRGHCGCVHSCQSPCPPGMCRPQAAACVCHWPLGYLERPVSMPFSCLIVFYHYIYGIIFLTLSPVYRYLHSVQCFANNNKKTYYSQHPCLCFLVHIRGSFSKACTQRWNCWVLKQAYFPLYKTCHFPPPPATK